MNIALPGRGWNRSWSDTMINLGARKLISTANQLSAFYLYDGLTRIRFVEEIKQIVEQQFAAARRARTDEECMACIKNLRAETENLREQDRLLRTKAARLYAEIEFVRENNKIVGYVISAVKIIVSGLTAYGGGMLIATGTPIGVLAGAILIMDGVNGISKGFVNFKRENAKESEGIIADRSLEIA